MPTDRRLALYTCLMGPAGTLKPWAWVVWVFQLAMLACLTAGLLGLSRYSVRSRTGFIDAAVIVLTAGVLAGILIGVPYAGVRGLNHLQGTVRLAFVLRDVIIFAALINLVTVVRWSVSVLLLCTGVAGLLGYGVLFRLAFAHGNSLSGTPIDLAWILFFAALGAAALVPSMATLDSAESATRRAVAPLRLGLVAFAALQPSAVLLIGSFSKPVWYQPIIAAVATVILVLVVLRTVDVAVRLRRQIAAEMVLRDAIASLAAAPDAASVIGALNEADAGRFLTRRADYRLILTNLEPAALSGLIDTATMSPPIAAQLGPGPALAIPLATSPAERRGAVRDRQGRPRQPTPRCGAPVDVASRVRPRFAYEVATTAGGVGGWSGLALERLRLHAENIRHTSESYFRTLVQNSTDVILIVDDDNRIRYASPSAGSVFGSTALTGCRTSPVSSHSPTAKPRVTPAGAGARGGRRHAGERSLDTTRTGDRTRLTSDGMVVTDVVRDGDWMVNGNGAGPARVEVSCRDLRADPSIDGLVLTLRNVTKQRLLESELEQRAFHDPLTGLGNRLPFSERLTEEVEAARTAGGGSVRG